MIDVPEWLGSTPPYYIDGEPLSAVDKQKLINVYQNIGKYVAGSEDLGGIKPSKQAQEGAECLRKHSVDPGMMKQPYVEMHTWQHYRRYLVAQQWNEEKAFNSALATVAWRHKHIPDTLASMEQYESCFASRYAEWIGHDEAGRPVLHIQSNQADLKIPRNIRENFCLHKLEKGIQLMQPKYSGKEGVEQWVMVVDETDKGWGHNDNKFLSHLGPMLFNHYVERLHCCYVVNPGIITSACLKLIFLFIDERTKSKVKLVKVKKEHPESPPNTPTFAPDLIAGLGKRITGLRYGGERQEMPVSDYVSFFNSIA
jgi:hypothetical protein